MEELEKRVHLLDQRVKELENENKSLHGHLKASGCVKGSLLPPLLPAFSPRLSVFSGQDDDLDGHESDESSEIDVKPSMEQLMMSKIKCELEDEDEDDT